MNRFRNLPMPVRAAIFLSLWLGMPPAYAAPPAWWADPATKIWETAEPAGDKEHFAPVNIGQLKHIAKQAKAHLDLAVADVLPGYFGEGSGAEIAALVAGFDGTDNFAPANVGQLKAVAKVFYDRLHELGYDVRTFLVSRGVGAGGPFSWNPYGRA